MLTSNSPLENLAAFAIVFALGAISSLGLSRYIDKVKHDSGRIQRPM